MRLSFVLVSTFVILAGAAHAATTSSSQPTKSLPTAELAGRVVDAAGHPVADAFVAANLLKDDAAPAAVARTRSDGRFALSLADGDYAVTASAPGRTGVYLSKVTVAAKQRADITLTLGDGGVSIWGTVLDSDGRPVAGALARLARVSSDVGDAWYVPVDAAGHFAVSLPQARYGVAAIAKGFEATSQYPRAADWAAHPVAVELTPNDPASPDVLRELGAASLALESTDPATPTLADLEPLARLVEHARVVGLGEASHGGREIFQLKHRLFRFLVERLGFTVLAIEASWADTLAIEDYLATGKGDPELLVSGMRFWIWDTDELTALVRWMRAYNVAPDHPHKLHFIGFDMQFAPTSVAALRAYFGAAERAYAGAREPLADLGNELDVNQFSTRPPAQRESTKRAVAALLAHLDARRAALIAKSGLAAWNRARHHAEILAQFVELQLDRGDAYSINRDRFMAQNIAWIAGLEPPGTNIAVWAHNGHVQKTPYYGTPTMGAALAKRFGDAYVALATCFGEGSFHAIGIRPARALMEFTVPAPPIGSVEGTLGRLGPDVVGVDLHRLPSGGAADRWAHHSLRMRTLGSAYTASVGQGMAADKPALAADALFFIRHLTASHYHGPIVGPMTPLPSASNGDFEEPATAPPAKWRLAQLGINAGYRSAVDGTGCFAGRQCALVMRTAPARMPGYATLEQVVDATRFRGRRVRLRAAVRVTTHDNEGGAELFLQAEDAQLKTLSANTTLGKRIRAPQWATYETLLDVPAEGALLRFGMAVTGDAQAWLDAVDLDVVLAATPVSP